MSLPIVPSVSIVIREDSVKFVVVVALNAYPRSKNISSPVVIVVGVEMLAPRDFCTNKEAPVVSFVVRRLYICPLLELYWKPLVPLPKTRSPLPDVIRSTTPGPILTTPAKSESPEKVEVPVTPKVFVRSRVPSNVKFALSRSAELVELV